MYRPQNAQELFNLRHSSARNAVERIFGVVKKKFHLLSAGASYSIAVQAKMVHAICALHNFIRVHDVDDEEGDQFQLEDQSQLPGPAELQNYLGSGRITHMETEDASVCRDNIANAMWEDYLIYLNGR